MPGYFFKWPDRTGPVERLASTCVLRAALLRGVTILIFFARTDSRIEAGNFERTTLAPTSAPYDPPLWDLEFHCEGTSFHRITRPEYVRVNTPRLLSHVRSRNLLFVDLKHGVTFSPPNIPRRMVMRTPREPRGEFIGRSADVCTAKSRALFRFFFRQPVAFRRGGSPLFFRPVPSGVDYGVRVERLLDDVSLFPRITKTARGWDEGWGRETGSWDPAERIPPRTVLAYRVSAFNADPPWRSSGFVPRETYGSLMVIFLSLQGRSHFVTVAYADHAGRVSESRVHAADARRIYRFFWPRWLNKDRRHDYPANGSLAGLWNCPSRFCRLSKREDVRCVPE